MKAYHEFFLNTYRIFKKMTIFAAENLVPQAPVQGVLRIKRESGENPEQTRCCISHQVVTHSFSVTVPSWGWEGRVTMG